MIHRKDGSTTATKKGGGKISICRNSWFGFDIGLRIRSEWERTH